MKGVDMLRTLSLRFDRRSLAAWYRRMCRLSLGGRHVAAPPVGDAGAVQKGRRRPEEDLRAGREARAVDDHGRVVRRPSRRAARPTTWCWSCGSSSSWRRTRSARRTTSASRPRGCGYRAVRRAAADAVPVATTSSTRSPSSSATFSRSTTRSSTRRWRRSSTPGRESSRSRTEKRLVAADGTACGRSTTWSSNDPAEQDQGADGRGVRHPQSAAARRACSSPRDSTRSSSR